MRLYHHPMSSNSRRAVMTAIHLGAPVERVLIDLAKGAQRSASFLRKNPNGKVPVLEDDGFILWESHAIMQYLADTTPGGEAIYPTEPRARADVNRWLFWSAHHFQPAVSVLGWERVVKGMIGAGAPDPAEEKRGEALVSDLGRILDAHLEGKEWIAQDKLTLADFAIATPLAFMDPARLPLGDFRRLLAWFSRVRETEPWKATSPSPDDTNM
ncbi:MAG: glutathione S-transferase family protein [Polyangiaceae bacterium]